MCYVFWFWTLLTTSLLHEDDITLLFSAPWVDGRCAAGAGNVLNGCITHLNLKFKTSSHQVEYIRLHYISNLMTILHIKVNNKLTDSSSSSCDSFDSSSSSSYDSPSCSCDSLSPSSCDSSSYCYDSSSFSSSYDSSSSSSNSSSSYLNVITTTAS